MLFIKYIGKYEQNTHFPATWIRALTTHAHTNKFVVNSRAKAIITWTTPFQMISVFFSTFNKMKCKSWSTWMNCTNCVQLWSNNEWCTWNDALSILKWSLCNEILLYIYNEMLISNSVSLSKFLFINFFFVQLTYSLNLKLLLKCFSINTHFKQT